MEAHVQFTLVLLLVYVKIVVWGFFFTTECKAQFIIVRKSVASAAEQKSGGITATYVFIFQHNISD